MNIQGRKLKSEHEYWRIRRFLREVFLLNDRRQRSWDVCRWDYWRYHGLMNCDPSSLMDEVFLWETAAGEIAGVLNSEGPEDAFLQMHPGLRSPALEREMIVMADECLGKRPGAQRGTQRIWAPADDPLRQEILQRLGYTRGEGPEYQRRRPMDLPIPAHVPAGGYSVRGLGEVNELPARSWASWKGFHPDEPDEKYSGWEWYRNVQRCPLYRRDLDIVAVAPDGAIASFCTVWFDDHTRMGIFEPVATHPDHLRRGLGSAVMAEGLRRLAWYGADLAFVSSYSEAAGRLYASMGFTDVQLSYPWSKV